MEKPEVGKIIHVTAGILKFKSRPAEGKEPHGYEQPLYPSVDDTMTSPFTAYGTLSMGNEAHVKLVSKTTFQEFQGTPVQPPPGAQWAFRFDVPVDDYKLVDTENGSTYVVDPIHVIQ